MPLTGSRTFVGFGFGAIQAGLFLYEAFRSGGFKQLTVAEVLPDVVAAVRRQGGSYVVNIAQADHVETATVRPVALEDPAVAADRTRLIKAITLAEELATAVPSVQGYVSPGPGSIHRLLAAGLRRKIAYRGPRCVVYAAENHNHAAEILEEHVLAEIPAPERDAVRARVRFLNTVIGKMSGIVSAPEELRALRLAPVTPEDRRAFLVEGFNRILVSRVNFPQGPGRRPFRRGLSLFAEKDNLLPFEEAKLYGHNATHALAAYVGAARGVKTLAELRGVPGMLDFLRAAFVEESGDALVRKYPGVGPLFTFSGYRAYVDDLLVRMTNPFLNDRVERVGRDPQRKLGWDDRLAGTIRLALSQGVQPRRYAFGAAAALAFLDADLWDPARPAAGVLNGLWPGAPAGERDAVVNLIEAARRDLARWRAAGFPELEPFLAAKSR